jgi:transposase-like protein
VPRDRNGSFQPQIVPPHERRFAGFDDNILSLYSRGMTTREIKGICRRSTGGGIAVVDLRGDRHGAGSKKENRYNQN